MLQKWATVTKISHSANKIRWHKNHLTLTQNQRLSPTRQGCLKVVDVNLFLLRPERTSMKLERSHASSGVNFSSVTWENALSTWAFDNGRVSNLMTPSAKSFQHWFPPASWNASTSSQKALMAWSLVKPADAMFLQWLSKVSTEQEKNWTGKSFTLNLFIVDITSFGQKSSSLCSISIDAGRRIWYCTTTSFRKLKQRAEILSFS